MWSIWEREGECYLRVVNRGGRVGLLWAYLRGHCSPSAAWRDPVRGAQTRCCWSCWGVRGRGPRISHPGTRAYCWNSLCSLSEKRERDETTDVSVLNTGRYTRSHPKVQNINMEGETGRTGRNYWVHWECKHVSDHYPPGLPDYHHLPSLITPLATWSLSPTGVLWKDNQKLF